MYGPLHALWAQYAEGVVGDDTRCVAWGPLFARPEPPPMCSNLDTCVASLYSPAALAVKVSKLDLHGAVLRGSCTRTPPCAKVHPAPVAHSRTHARTHPSPPTVARSRHPPYVGLEGIVAKESTNMFYLITRANELKIVPKLSNVFTVAIGATTVATLYGNQLVCRPGERIVRKFKSKGTIDL